MCDDVYHDDMIGIIDRRHNGVLSDNVTLLSDLDRSALGTVDQSTLTNVLGRSNDALGRKVEYLGGRSEVVYASKCEGEMILYSFFIHHSW